MTNYFLSRGEFVERIGVHRGALSRYKLPKPDVIVGKDTARPIFGWLPETIDEWNKHRPGRGARTDLQK